jgi:hypothetical protein
MLKFAFLELTFCIPHAITVLVSNHKRSSNRIATTGKNSSLTTSQQVIFKFIPINKSLIRATTWAFKLGTLTSVTVNIHLVNPDNFFTNTVESLFIVVLLFFATQLYSFNFRSTASRLDTLFVVYVVTAVNLLTGLTFTRDNGYLLTISQLADK